MRESTPKMAIISKNYTDYTGARLNQSRVNQTGARERSQSREEKARVFSLSRASYSRSRRALATQADFGFIVS